MSHVIKLDKALSVGSQSTKPELKSLAGRGYGSIINLRADGEDDQPLSPRDEGVKVRNLGLEYVSISVPIGDIQSKHADNFRAKLQFLPTPIFVHCAGGTRAAALALCHKAVSEGRSGEQALKEAERLGLPCQNPPIREFVANYVDQRQTRWVDGA